MCKKIVVPANGYLDDSARRTGWKCERGFRHIGANCVSVELPENAHLDHTGNTWDCDRPFRRVGTSCQLP